MNLFSLKYQTQDSIEISILVQETGIENVLERAKLLAASKHWKLLGIYEIFKSLPRDSGIQKASKSKASRTDRFAPEVIQLKR